MVFALVIEVLFVLSFLAQRRAATSWKNTYRCATGCVAFAAA